ncbi:MAG: response regulator transcription factor [Saprospiraceae bacterium]|nr:response regulator transcription factor [Saprospiraceae bacterium]
MTKILIVDDEIDILDFLSYNLKKEGFEVLTASNGLEAIEKARESHPQLIILDIMMPHLDGIEVCRRLRQNDQLHNTIITFLTARDEDFTQIRALDVGGDDFITKPIMPQVLISRVKALLRRNKPKESPNANIIQAADLIIDKEKVQVLRGEQIIDLPKKEFELLLLLVSKPGKVFSRDEIYHKIWGSDVIVGDRTIDVHIRKLREKIGSDQIKTLKGIGYKFDL